MIAYITRADRYGKMQVTRNDASSNHGRRFDYTTFAADGAMGASTNDILVPGTWGFDLDLPSATPGTGVSDFWFWNKTAAVRSLTPLGTARFYMLP